MVLRFLLGSSRLGVLSILLANTLVAQEEQTPPVSGLKPWTTAEDHREMMKQLGITRLRPGPSGDPSKPNAANTDESMATPFKTLPDPLLLHDGGRVQTALEWWSQRRKEILEDLEREVVGRVPSKVPDVAWTVVGTKELMLGETPAIEKQLEGLVDSKACPEIEVKISMVVVTPKDAPARVPCLMMFGFTGYEPWAEEFRRRSGGRAFGPPPGAEPPATQQLVEQGWGYAILSPSTVQRDDGAGLTRGIIGLCNRGEPRKPEDWGALRAWAWGASRGFDYLATDPAIDVSRVGIEGVSRFGKAALVTMAFDERFSVALIGSAGEGGASLYRRNFGEAVENLTGSGEYHWMAGNFLKYGTEESSFGRMDASDLPTDAHHVMALCAPRPIFISYGIPEKGDALWLDQQGSFMAAIAAQPVYRLLGARDLGRTDDYMTEKMPPVNEGLLDGDLAWRQHDGGHTDLPNIKHFVPWANARLALPRARSAMVPRPRWDRNSAVAHHQLCQKTRQGKTDIYFVGDSITRRWGATDYPELLAHWNHTFHGRNAANFGWGGDRVEHVLWRMVNGECDHVTPRVVVVQVGTNNVPGLSDSVSERDVIEGMEMLVRHTRDCFPKATLLITGIFPRGDGQDTRGAIARINQHLSTLCDGTRIRFVDVGRTMIDESGALREGLTADGLHPTLAGYTLWASALQPHLQDILGPPAEMDEAPPATGDPSKQSRRAPH